MKKIVLLIIFWVFLFACSSSKETLREQPADKATAEFDESFDPLTLDDDDIVIEKNQKTVKSLTSDKQQPVKVENPVTQQHEKDGYRVQILATKNIEAATVTQQSAQERFGVMNHKTYLIFDVQYKVRVGDALSRAEAEEIRDLALDYGYKGAFIVRSKVVVGSENTEIPE
jgi:uncharacterized protein YcfL